jgi:ribose transport system permease protein
MTPAAMPAAAARTGAIGSLVRRNAWSLGLIAFFLVLLAFTKFINPAYDSTGIQNLGIAILPLAFATVAQAVVVISGGIDLSLGSVMALTSVVAAVLMKGQSEQAAVLVVIAVLLLGMALGAINGGLSVATRVPDIVVTLAMSYVWAGFALYILERPGGASAAWLKSLMSGSLLTDWLPQAAIVLVVVVGATWIPIMRSRLGLSIYAVGSNRLAAFRSGISVGRTRILAYVIAGFFAAFGGLSLTATTGIATPVPGPYTLNSVAAIVLGGVSLAGGRGGIVGPIVGVLILQLVRTDMTFLNVDTNLATVLQGVILIGVVMIGSLLEMRRSRA